MTSKSSDPGCGQVRFRQVDVTCDALRSPAPSPFRMRQAARLLRAGGVVAYPTEGVFGLGCDPANERALRRVIALKGRSPAKGLILIAASAAQALQFADTLPEEMSMQLHSSWPGPVTWVVPARPDLSSLITGGRDTVAVRVTAHPGAAALCRAFRGALVSTSANPTGRRPVDTPLAARQQFGGLVDAIVPGRTGARRAPSEIRDARDGRVLRGAG